MIKVSINVNNIEKNRLYEGAKGKYLNLILIPTPNSTKGDDYMVVQEVTQEERQAGTRGPILGNGKILGKGKPSTAAKRQQEDGEPW